MNRYTKFENPKIGQIGFIEFVHFSDTMNKQYALIPYRLHAFDGQFLVCILLGSNNSITIPAEEFLQIL